MNDEFHPHSGELAILAAMIFPTARDPKKAVRLAEEIAREAHARSYAIHVELCKKEGRQP
jgi:hypothetical protein